MTLISLPWQSAGAHVIVIELHAAVSFTLSEVYLGSVTLAFEAPENSPQKSVYPSEALLEHALNPSSPKIDVDTQNNEEEHNCYRDWEVAADEEKTTVESSELKRLGFIFFLQQQCWP